MNYPENDKWLDDALAETIGSKKTEPNFEKWKQGHPQAVEMLTARAARGPSASKSPLRIRITIMKSSITKLAAAAIIIIAALIGINSLNGTTTWAKVIKAFNDVENVHIIEKINISDGKVQKKEVWIRMPDCLCEDNQNRTVIDNGTDRLIIDKEKKTAQFSDSFMPYKSVSEHYIFDGINIFRGGKQDELELKKLEDESTETMLVFCLQSKEDTIHSDIKGKAWVDAKTILPLKIQVELISEPKEGDPVSVEVIWDYDPIPDSVFTMVVPEDYKELPRKQKGRLSGTVLDENDKPVANAVVFCVDRAGEFSRRTMTNETGMFISALSPEAPEGVGKRIWLPIMFRAFVENVPDKVAWSIIKDPECKEVPGGHIPYDVASVEIDGCRLRSANGIILRMEPAGTIAGQVTDINDNPIPDAQIKLIRCNISDKHGNIGLTGIDILHWNGRGDEGIVRTNKDGRYELNNLPRFWKRTRFTVQAKAQEHSTEKSIVYPQGPIEHEELDFQLYPYKSDLIISGVLKDNYGNLLEERYIHLRINGKDYLLYRTVTDKQGRFQLVGSPISEKIEVRAFLSTNSFPLHDKEKYMSYVYYPSVIVDIGYQKNKTSYEVEIIAEKPELVVEVKVKDSSGKILPYFPVEIRSDILFEGQWTAERNFTQRTDQNGYCKFTEVPNIEGLKLVLSCVGRMYNDKLPSEERVNIAQKYRKYKKTEVPIELIQGQKEYKVDVTMLANEEHKR